MRVLKDVISGDELVSDSFPLTDQGVVFVAKGKVTTVVQNSCGTFSPWKPEFVWRHLTWCCR